MEFGFSTREFEVTPERLGVYRPEIHIDNPKVGVLGCAEDRAGRKKGRSLIDLHSRAIRRMQGRSTVIFGDRCPKTVSFAGSRNLLASTISSADCWIQS